ncbi:MAG: RNA polymerase sigma factor [Bacteroidia bacterium]
MRIFTTQTYKETELIEGCKKNDAKMQQALYYQFYRKMYGVCLRYANDKDEAVDILQDGFIQVFKYIQDFRGGSLEGWIRRIMVNMAIAHYRKKMKFSTTDIDNASDAGFDEDSVSSMTCEEILKYIQALPTGYKTIFNLYEIEGYSHVEIAEMLGISVGTSKSQLSRAKEILRKQLTVNS